jgi:hypothetical protein
MNAEPQFRFGVLASGAIVVGIIAYLRFCGSLSLPPKPPPPSGPSGTQQQLLARSTGSPAVYQQFLQNDSAAAGVQAPSIEDMSRKFAYRVDDARHVLELGKPPIEVAGLRLHLERTNDQVVLVIKNITDSEIAYEVSTQPSIPASACMRASPLPFNAMVIEKGATATRTECIWRDGLSIIVTKTETMEINDLGGYYLSLTPPSLVGIDPRIARGHRGGSTKEPCSTVLAQAVRGGMDRGDIGWRDLADFYARHRCPTYQFPSAYRAFRSDGERSLPAVDSSL